MNYTIPNIFLEAFGLQVTKSYNPEVSDGNPNDPNILYTGIEIIKDIETAKEISGLGTPIIYPIYFSAGTYKKYSLQGEIENAVMSDFRLPIASIVSFKKEKIVGVTKINGGNGTVKEIYGFDDFKVTINGFLIPDASQPQGFKKSLDQEKELLKWNNLASSIAV
jgi:Domain of unknown function (DUF6046)